MSVKGEEMKNAKNLNNSIAPTERTALRPKLETFDDVLPYVGDFGRYQWLLLLSLLPHGVTYAFLYFLQFFVTLIPPEHWCKMDELMGKNFTQEDRVQIAIPPSNEYPYYDQCHRKDLNFAEILKSGEDLHSYQFWNNQTVECTSWEYNYTQIPYASIGTELDWVCEREYLVSTAQAIFFCGSIVGGFVLGWLADHKGRIPALMVCNSVALLGSIATANANSFWSFAVCRFITGLAFDNCINIPLIIVLEYMAISKRSVVVNITYGTYFAVASTILPWMAYYIANWRIFAYVTAFPMLFVFIIPWTLPESARWYVSNGRMDLVLEKLHRIARINRKTPDPRIFTAFADNLEVSTRHRETATVFDLFKSPRLARNTLLLALFWCFTLIAFDGHVYSLKLLQSSVFMSFSLTCFTELPAGLLLAVLLDRWGRRFCGFLTLAMTCLFSIAELMLHSTVAKLTMSVMSRFCLNMAANIGLQYAVELLPTPVRSQGISLIHILGIISRTLAPYINDSAKVWEGFPMLIISTISFMGAMSVLFLPETLGHNLPQTINQGEEFGKDQNFWSLPNHQKTFDQQRRYQSCER
ncbi:carcinine transporter-like isoform X2 [Nomia melanderi]|uniref:carcinine transporter-like isoform X2 n=1 Tax=Nomia melanderi TaxID=2448451 RepID=UPI0013041E76|nr:carcinine transporter-like isoform X2 [Nomia melanderi]XP_031842347.1 carcinine transporter-like isoform X2 [Nomia melanderi]XP_031842348.1 carcinine transporter-like isoform X2 [Nomia melanderi]XP_031842349.1 carcinine transporter-like isoform X2 [Nomia melanderi]XP_031842350.1 carcinine transporter-like isoform X2 [Nomia melanderi]XP_031842351.1 carcinine transporter-like isoform X2 [Nomia melanderi]